MPITWLIIALVISALVGLSIAWIFHIQTRLQSGIHHMQHQFSDHFNTLLQQTDHKLQLMGGLVEKRLTEGFEKTTSTFTDVIKRLALIDEAQKKITELSGNVLSLQDLLNDKRSRGAFGEVQLQTLILNLLPAAHVQFQCTLSNHKRVDCLLILPPPSGNIAIDAKFPLETYRRLMEVAPSRQERTSLEQQFKQDIRKHLQDISEKYIIPGETADGAMMFIPAESIFAEIHSHYPELIDLSHQLRVWMVSPTTLMAVLTTARAVLKDAATREQVHLIQEHLSVLAKDFSRFDKRMENLAKHIQQAHEDVADVQRSAHKITQRFIKIEKVELEEQNEEVLYSEQTT